ncbi:MAG TPA: DUF5916 domain-containing protein [Gemmatimonadaceae bacterium]|nr:DUF5916 domain-containing protein [Gemmatimonadaceae bacterium]
MTHVRAAAILVAGLISSATAGAQAANGNVHPTPAPAIEAVRLTQPVTVDGRLDEEVWRTAPAATEFRQSQPDEGDPATQRTEVRFAYDEGAIYVGARMFDSLGARGVQSRVLRRDALTESDSDFLQIIFDSYHDHVSRSFFYVNPSGAKRDGTGDNTWDPVWETAARVDSLGWTAEMRIPFNQLNFSREAEQTWGVQIIRFVHRLNERQHFAWWPNNEVGGPSRYGHLEGIRIIERPRGMELVPYVVTQGNFVRPPDPLNPFRDAREYKYRVGADVKYRLTSNLTLNAAINPDFGQVEVDPAVVNLTAFETFFQERRPFFIEGSNMFGFGDFSCYFCSNVSSLQMFYTRRIGRNPQLFPAGNYVDMPDNTTILGAGKVTGRVGSNTIGVLNALTRAEKADVLLIDSESGERTQFQRDVEPATNYFVGRVRRELRGGASSIGAILTSVDRFTSDSLADARLPGAARGLGLDWFHSWKNRAYSFMGQYALSDVHGSVSAIDRLQRAPARYFQRPDSEGGSNGLFSNALDPAADRLTGYAGYARIAKDGGTFNWEAMVNYRSPGFEVNDISFLTRSDYLWMNTNVARSITKPGPVYRNYFLVTGAQQQFNYDGDLIDRQLHAGIFGQLRNYWQLNAFVIRRAEIFDDRLTRGGPVVKRAGNTAYFTFISTDQRKPIFFWIEPNYQVHELGTRQLNVSTNVTYRPSSRIRISLGPYYGMNESPYQFVTSGVDSSATDFYGRRYIFAHLQRREFSMNTRLNVAFTPDLTLEAFAQPLISAGNYVTFRQFAAPRDAELHDLGPDQISVTGEGGNRVYTVDADGPAGTAAQPIQFGAPDFNFRSLRGNAVLRWEYRPGSTLFFVWQQNRTDQAPLGDFDFSRDRRALFSAHPDNIFLIKATYWFAM